VSFVFAALCAVPAAYMKSPEGLLFAFLPLCFGLASVVNWNRGFQLSISASGLRTGGGRNIPFTSFREVRPLAPSGKARPSSFGIEVVHAAGVLVIPPHLSEPSERVYDFLKKQVGPRTALMPPELLTFASEQRELFGPEKVFIWGTRAPVPNSHRPLDPYAWIAMSVGGLTWLVTGVASTRFGALWIALGIFALITAAILLAVDTSSRGGAIRVLAGSGGLVITPAAIALQLGDLKGQLAWEEILAVVHPIPTGCIAVRAAPTGIAIDVDGARIVLTDSFTHPLDEIHPRILRNWRPN
jgi:hypothetical protein